jgi:hypothetical protein
MTKEKLALDLKYLQNSPNNEAAMSLTDDIASLGLEASGQVNPYILVVTKEKKVVSPTRPTKDVCELYSSDTDLERQETKAALKRRDYLLEKDGNFVVIWISPSGPYPSGRLDVGISREIDGLKALESYGININFTDRQYLTLGNNLSSLGENQIVIEQKEDLRENVFLINLNESQDPYDLLEELIPLPNIWENIRNQKAKELKEKYEKQARKLAKKHIKRIKKASNIELFHIGATIEIEMQKMWNTDIEKEGCGISNLRYLKEYVFNHQSINSRGNSHFSYSERGKFVKKCPYCGAVINKTIEPGYICSCGKEYKGVC